MMTKIVIEYSTDKDLMLTEAITRAANKIDLKRIIWLVWTDSDNLRNYFFNKEMTVLGEDEIRKLLKGGRLDYGSYYIRSIPVKQISAIHPEDIVIDCFTGELYGALNFNASKIIHLPWTEHENDLLQKYRYKIIGS